MKEFTWGNFPRRLVRGTNFQPFPGIYPTRWAIDMRWGQSRRGGYTHHWRYLGKPNQAVASYVRRILQTATYSVIRGSEFVRNGSIAVARSYGPRDHMQIHDWNQNLFRVVDPWNGAVNTHMITHWAAGRMRPLPIIYKGKQFVTYADPAQISTERLLTYKQWLESANIKPLSR